MKSFPLACVILASGVAVARPARGAGVSRDGASRLALVGDDYRKVEVLPPSFFNPFKVRATSAIPLDRDSNLKITDDAVLQSLEHAGVTGMLLASGGRECRVILGDQVFGVGDTLEFPDGDNPVNTPLLKGAKVVLKGITPVDLDLEVTFAGEAPHPLTFPLRSFWRP
jgi:hypothetical protein